MGTRIWVVPMAYQEVGKEVGNLSLKRCDDMGDWGPATVFELVRMSSGCATATMGFLLDGRYR